MLSHSEGEKERYIQAFKEKRKEMNVDKKTLLRLNYTEYMKQKKLEEENRRPGT